jgi:predicted actin-binding protein
MVLGMVSFCRRLGSAMCAGLVALLLALPAGAQAATFTSGPTVEGAAIVGSSLEVVWVADAPVTAIAWRRCSADGTTCDPLPIPGAVASTYLPTAADVGHALVADVTVTDTAGPLTKTSAPTTAVVAAPTPPPPPSPPAPPPPATTTTTAASTAVAHTAPSFLRPFPVIRIRGFFARRGARITLLSVRGPRLAKVDVRCSGRGCPVGKLSLPTADTRVHRFERFLRAGILLQIRVTRPGRIGTYTSFLIRSKKAPKRTDRCLTAKSVKPIRCSAP